MKFKPIGETDGICRRTEYMLWLIWMLAEVRTMSTSFDKLLKSKPCINMPNRYENKMISAKVWDYNESCANKITEANIQNHKFSIFLVCIINLWGTGGYAHVWIDLNFR